MCSDSFWFKRKQIRKDILIILHNLIWFSSEVQTWELIRVFSAKIIKWSSQNASVGFSCIWIFLFGSLYIQAVSVSKANNWEKIRCWSNTLTVVAVDLSLSLSLSLSFSFHFGWPFFLFLGLRSAFFFNEADHDLLHVLPCSLKHPSLFQIQLFSFWF